MMPEMDGYSFYNECKNNPKLEDIPFIFLTAKSQIKDIRTGMASGAEDYITKPFDPLLPYYVPFRALTAKHIDNLVIPGKGMAQTFLANAGTRLHPTEWSTGVAAGAAAYIMATENKSTSDIHKYDIERLQMILTKRLGSPLTWTF